jgi:MSHA biogenesis protein MshK
MACRLILLIVGLAALVGAHAAPIGDPTRPPWAEGEAPPGAAAVGDRVEMILVAPDRRFALIGGRLVRVGDEVGGARVVRIGTESVTLRREDSVEELPLYPAVQKKKRRPQKMGERAP